MYYSYISKGVLYGNGIPYWGLPKLIQYSGFCDQYVAVDVNHDIWSINEEDQPKVKRLTKGLDITTVYSVDEHMIHAISMSGDVFVIDIPSGDIITRVKFPSKAVKIGVDSAVTEDGKVYSILSQKEIHRKVIGCMLNYPEYALLPDGRMNQSCDLKDLNNVIGFGLASCWTSDGTIYGLSPNVVYLKGLPEPENIVCISNYTDEIHVLYRDGKLMIYDACSDGPSKVIEDVELISDRSDCRTSHDFLISN